jgi:hypothetical protein
MKESAIKGLSIIDMKKLLSEFRNTLVQQTMEDPFHLSVPLSNGQTVSEFTYLVCLGMHQKRRKKPQSTNASGASDTGLIEGGT